MYCTYIYDLHWYLHGGFDTGDLHWYLNRVFILVPTLEICIDIYIGDLISAPWQYCLRSSTIACIQPRTLQVPVLLRCQCIQRRIPNCVNIVTSNDVQTRPACAMSKSLCKYRQEISSNNMLEDSPCVKFSRPMCERPSWCRPPDECASVQEKARALASPEAELGEKFTEMAARNAFNPDETDPSLLLYVVVCLCIWWGGGGGGGVNFT